MRHDAIVVTSWNAEHLETAWIEAKRLGLTVSPVICSPVNGYGSFLIVPDGSKEGWEESDTGDNQRHAWKLSMRKQEEMWVDWAEITFGGDDDRFATVNDHSGLKAANKESP